MLRGLSSVLIVTGVLLVADGAVTLAWQEPLSAIYASIQQDQLNGQLHQLERTAPTPAELRALAAMRGARERIRFLARELWARAHPGQALGRIKIPKINANYVVVQGTDETSLHKGPGHYPATPLPGMPGTVAIAGHRTTYLAPFRRINELKPGNNITLEMPYGIFTYRVQYVRVVLPTDLAILRPQGYDRLVLSACHPLYSASHRIIAFAALVRIQPQGAVLAVPGASATPLRPLAATTVTPLQSLPPVTNAPPLRSLPNSGP
ncbi:MAG: sortase [Solirubrobacteraceae bacterium]|nr:MAG: hypothetical protein DLM63_00645 [Solirubrobacterales bacterium]